MFASNWVGYEKNGVRRIFQRDEMQEHWNSTYGNSKHQRTRGKDVLVFMKEELLNILRTIANEARDPTIYATLNRIDAGTPRAVIADAVWNALSFMGHIL